MAELNKYPTIYEAERPPNLTELRLWDRAEKSAKKTTLQVYRMRLLYANIVQAHKFAISHQISFDEPNLPTLEQRMIIAVQETEKLKELMCAVNRLELGVRISSDGADLDIVQPEESNNLGWIIPAIIGAVIVVGIIARWAHLELETTEIAAEYNGVLKRADMALCQDPGSQLCKDWQQDKATGGYFKRNTIIESVKGAIGSIGAGAKTGLGLGLALALPVLAWLYMPRRKES